MAKTLQNLEPHPVRSLLPALGAMEELGFDPQVCLKGTGILLSQLEDDNARTSVQQELAFYQSIIAPEEGKRGLRIQEFRNQQIWIQQFCKCICFG